MAKRKPAKRKPALGTAIRSAASHPKSWVLLGRIILDFTIVFLVIVYVVLRLIAPRGATPPEPETGRPVVTLDDTPAAAVTKSHARYILNFGDSLDEFAELAPTFGDSAAAAKWFTDRTARARAEAFGGKDGFDAYVFGHAGGDENGEDRYDAKTLAKGAKEMAEACRKSAAEITD